MEGCVQSQMRDHNRCSSLSAGARPRPLPGGIPADALVQACTQRPARITYNAHTHTCLHIHTGLVSRRPLCVVTLLLVLVPDLLASAHVAAADAPPDDASRRAADPRLHWIDGGGGDAFTVGSTHVIQE